MWPIRGDSIWRSISTRLARVSRCWARVSDPAVSRDLSHDAQERQLRLQLAAKVREPLNVLLQGRRQDQLRAQDVFLINQIACAFFIGGEQRILVYIVFHEFGVPLLPTAPLMGQQVIYPLRH